MKYYILFDKKGNVLEDSLKRNKIYSSVNILPNLFDKSALRKIDITSESQLEKIDDYFVLKTEKPQVYLKYPIETTTVLKTIKGLIKDGCNVRVNDDEFFTWVCAFYPIAIVKHMVELGCDVNAQEGMALVHAVSEGRLATVKYLIEKGANVHIAEDLPLFYAVFRNQPRIMKYLIEVGGWEDDMNGAFDYCCENGQLDNIKYMVEKGANINYDYSSPLRSSVKNGHIEVVKYLLEKGVDLKEYGEDSIEIATKNRYPKIAKLLKTAMKPKE